MEEKIKLSPMSRLTEDFLIERVSECFYRKIIKESGMEVTIMQCTSEISKPDSRDYITYNLVYKEHSTDTYRKLTIHVT